MRIKVLAFAASLLLISNSSAGYPQSPTPTNSQQASTLLAQSATALTGSTTITDVTLTGTVEWIAGSDDETGNVTYKGLSGAYRLDMTFRNGTRSEAVSQGQDAPTGTWTGLDGVSHPFVSQNLMTPPGWFPVFMIGNLLSSSNSVLVYLGQETREGINLIHLQSSRAFPDLSDGSAPATQRLTLADIYLDPTTLVPVSYVYTSHPDNNSYRDIPTEVRYSNYRPFGGGQIPFHVQKYMNNSLVLDLQFQSVTLNSGMTAAQVAFIEN